MALPETHNGGQEPPVSKPVAEAASSLIAGGDSQPPEARWGFWATAGLSLVVLAAFVGIQTAVAIGFVIVQIALSGRMLNEADAASLN